jgi:hypothetical protein
MALFSTLTAGCRTLGWASLQDRWSLRRLIGSPLVIGCLGLCWLCAVAVGEGGTEITLYTRGLRERGLHIIAEEAALRQLARPDLAESQRLQWTLELVSTLAEHAESVSLPQQSALFQAAAESLREEDGRSTVSAGLRDRLILEGELLEARRLLALAWEQELQPDSALQQSYLSEWPAVARTLQQRLETLSRVETLSTGQRELLSDRLWLSLVEGHLQAGLITADRVQRIGSWQTAEELMEQGLKLRGRTELQRELRLKRVRLARWREESTLWLAQSKSLATISAGSEFRDRVLAEQVRQALDRDACDEALELLTTTLRGRTDISAELRGLTAGVLLRSARLAASRQQAELQADLIRQADLERELTPGRWRRWIDIQRERLGAELQYGPKLAELVRQGQQAYAAGNLTEAARAFEAAAGEAHQEGRADEAVEFGLTRGSIYLQQGSYPQAVTSLRQLLEAYPQHPRANDVHLLLCYALGRQVATPAGQSDQQAYPAALQQHLERFPGSSTAGEAGWLLGNWQQSRNELAASVRSYRSIPAQHPRYWSGWEQVLRIDRELLRTASRGAAAPKDQAEQVWQHLMELADGLPLPPQELKLEEAQVALAAARLLVEHFVERSRDADTLLQRIVSSAAAHERRARQAESEPDPAWSAVLRQGEQLRIVSLAGQSRFNEARQLLDQLAAADEQTYLDVLVGLAELAKLLPEAGRREIGRIQQAAVEKFQPRRGTLGPQAQRQLDEILAAAYVASGDLPEAVQIYERLLSAEPGNTRLQRTIAELLVARGTPPDLRRAEQVWAELERQSPPGSVPWLEVRLERLKALVAVGELPAARKLLGVTRILYPALGNAELKQQYELLAQQLQSNSQTP